MLRQKEQLKQGYTQKKWFQPERVGEKEKNKKKKLLYYFFIFYLSYKLDPFQKENGEIIHDSSSITQKAKRFYEKLYTSHENDAVNTDTGNTAALALPAQEEISDSLEGLITLHEALSALKQM